MRMFQRLTVRDRAVRPLPFPYRGALALSSDAEYFSLELLDELMRFLNTRDATRLGRGLGLEVTASMFFYSESTGHLSYFAGDERQAPRSADGARLEEYMRSGWVDTNHAFGAFSGVDRFTRGHADRVYETLADLGAVLPVFTNHGGNSCNLGGHAADYAGDLPGHVAHHADLLTSRGVEFVWLDDPRFVTERVPARGWRRRVDREARRLARRVRAGDVGVRSNRRLFGSAVLRDGTRVTTFTRLRSTGYDAPNFSSLMTQVREIDWHRLYRNHGVVVVYQHLGVLERRGGSCTPATADELRRRPEVYLAPFRALARESERGLLWVCGTARLLRYARMAESVNVRHEPGDARYVITTPDRQSNVESLEGLTFYIDPGGPVHAVHQDRGVPVMLNGPDETGRPSATVPMTPLPAIW